MRDRTKTLVWSFFLLLVTAVGLPAQASIADVSADYEYEIELTYKKLDDGRRELATVMTASNDDVEVPVEGMLVNFFVGEVSREGGWGNEMTDAEGKATRILAADLEIPRNEEGKMVFIARCKHPNLPLIETRVAYKDATFELSLNEEDKTVKARLVELTPEGKVPVEQTKVDFAVKRFFGDITFGGDFTYTDESGEVSVEFPADIPTDSEGKVVVAAGLTDHEDFGTISKSIEVPWGTQPSVEDASQRALWAERMQAPWWLLISANLVLVGAWGSILFVLYLVWRLARGGGDHGTHR